MNKKELKKQEHVSMEKFLKNYVGIQNKKLLNCLSNLTHKEIKEICDEIYLIDLTRISFESVTKEDIESGKILLVLDKDNNPAPYTNPILDEFDLIIANENEKHHKETYTIENQLQTFEEYTDDLEEIALDTNTSSQKISVLSKKIYRKSILNKFRI